MTVDVFGKGIFSASGVQFSSRSPLLKQLTSHHFSVTLVLAKTSVTEERGHGNQGTAYQMRGVRGA